VVSGEPLGGAYSDYLKTQFAAEEGGGALEGVDVDVAFCFEDAVELGAAGVHAFGRAALLMPWRAIS